MYRGPESRNNLVLVRMADVDDDEAELYGASVASDVKLADSSIGNNESSLDLDGLGEKDEDDANDNAEDDDGCDYICSIVCLLCSDHNFVFQGRCHY